MSESVTDYGRLWSDLGPIKREYKQNHLVTSMVILININVKSWFLKSAQNLVSRSPPCCCCLCLPKAATLNKSWIRSEFWSRGFFSLLYIQSVFASPLRKSQSCYSKKRLRKKKVKVPELFQTVPILKMAKNEKKLKYLNCSYPTVGTVQIF